MSYVVNAMSEVRALVIGSSYEVVDVELQEVSCDVYLDLLA
jgi:hypothetical protein